MALILYSRRGCHLCEEMILDLELARPGAPPAFQVVDIDGDPDLVQEYGLRVPVLTRDGEILCEGALSPAAMEKILEK